MQTVIAFFFVIALASAGILQGPSSSAAVVGPDGSVINAFAPGGQVAVPDVVAYAAPAAAPVVVAAPAVPATYVAPAVAYAVNTEPPAPADSEGQYVPDDEGQYVPDNLEQQYDDGSYKGEWLVVWNVAFFTCIIKNIYNINVLFPNIITTYLLKTVLWNLTPKIQSRLSYAIMRHVNA